MKSSKWSRRLESTLAVLSVLCWSTTVCAAGQERSWVSGKPARGRDLLIERGCLACHAVRGSGGKAGPDLTAALVNTGIRPFTAAMVEHLSRAQPARRETPAALPAVNATETDDLLAYLFSVNFTSESGSAAQGALLFSRKGCVKCHWLSLSGSSVAPPPAQLARASAPLVAAQLMWNHATQMSVEMKRRQVPASRFEEHEMADLLAFLRGSSDPLSAYPPAMDAAAGRQLFQSKGCANCHVQNASGRLGGPQLLTGRWYLTATEIAGAMWNHRSILPDRPAAPHLDRSEMAQLIAYLYLLQSER